MRRAAIVAPVRSAVGSFGGSLRQLRAEDLAARVIEAVIDRSGVDPGVVEDVVFAQQKFRLAQQLRSELAGEP